jgi:hypothetical protein
MRAASADIWGTSDEFHFAWQQFSGAGMITAKIESIENTHEWAKAGVMIRDTLDADATHAMLAITPENGVWFGRRRAAGGISFDDVQTGIGAPYWVRLERTTGGLIRAYYSADGSTWVKFGPSESIPMETPMYIGLALTSNGLATCEAKFSNITSDGTGQWTNQDIGMVRNEAEPMYIAISDINGITETVYYEDPNATCIDDWKEWNINLKDFADQNVDLGDVNSIAIGFGDKNNLQAGGTGKMYFDDIRLYPPRYVPDKVIPYTGDFSNDGLVDFKDLKIMVNDWLQGDYAVAATTPRPPISWWKLENNTNDSIGDNHGFIYGNPIFVAGKYDQALKFDGDDYVDCGNSSVLDFGTSDWTICAWIKTTRSGTSDEEDKGTVFAKGGDQTDGIRYTLALNEAESGKITLTTDDNVTRVRATSSISVNDGLWHHVAGMRNGTELRVYVDAMLDGTTTFAEGYNLSGTSQHKAYIGTITDHRDGTLSKYFVGSIDEVQIYDYALSHTDIIGAAGLTEVYYPLTSQANISDEEPNKSKLVNFKDFAILADEWLKEPLIWPE